VKNYSILAIIIATSFTSQSQINVGSKELVKMKPGTFTPEQLSKFKNSKTVFVYRESDNIEELEPAIRGVWDVTEISFVPFSEYGEIDMDNTSIFSIGGVNSSSTSSSGMSRDNTHIYLSLWMPGKDKKDRAIKESYARIELHPTYVDYAKITTSERKKAMEYIYDEGHLKNWTVGFLKNYIQNVNSLLNKDSERWLYQNDEENPKVRRLRTKTLYIADYSMVKFNKFSGDESESLDPAKIFKSYTFDYELMDAEDLSQKILTEDEAFYYMVYIKSSTDKYLTVYNSKTGEIIYSTYVPASYNLKDSDMKDLAKAMK
jgi:hypothetical protein